MVIELMQNKLDSVNQNGASALFEDEEKQNENWQVPPFKAYHPSNKTLDFRHDPGSVSMSQGGSFKVWGRDDSIRSKLRMDSMTNGNNSVMFEIIDDYEYA